MAQTAAAPATPVVACDRACLEGMVERYFDAVVANDPSQVPLADDVVFTEDGQRLLIGDGLWNTMKSKSMVPDIAIVLEANDAWRYRWTAYATGRARRFRMLS